VNVRITVRYQPRPNSNVGKYVAKALGKQVSHTNDFTGDQYWRAAYKLAEKLGLILGEQIDGGPDDRVVYSTITRSENRIPLSPSLAFQQFESLDGHVWADLGPHMTCTETEIFCDFLASLDMHAAADSLREHHVREDEDGDMDHETGEYPED
jgi:hypothetical protein